MKKYLTKSGDYWDSIAKENLGSSKYTDKLMKANAKYLELEKFPAGIDNRREKCQRRFGRIHYRL